MNELSNGPNQVRVGMVHFSTNETGGGLTHNHFLASRPLSELRTPEEVTAAGSAKGEVHNEEVEGEVNPNAEDQSSKHVNAGLTEGEELESYIAIWKSMRVVSWKCPYMYFFFNSTMN